MAAVGAEGPVSCLLAAWQDHGTELRAWLRRRMADREEAEDLTQDVFLRALRQGARFCEVRNRRAWLFEVARNALADRLRLTRNLVELPEDLPELREEPPPVDALAEYLPRALAALSPAEREAITHCDLEGMNQADFARLKGLSLPGAKSRVQRARRRLREHLATACQVRFDESGRVCCFVPRGPQD